MGGFRNIYCGNFGFYFSNNKIQRHEEFMQSQITFPVSPQLNYTEIVDTKGRWQKISMQFTADQPYRYFLFGNFYSDAVTPINMPAEERMALDEKNQTLSFWEKNKRIAYYLFDDFAVVEDVQTTTEEAFQREKRYVFPNDLLFDSGKSELKKESGFAIDGLAETLHRNPGLAIEIEGHTDDVGANADNQRLSEDRARSIFEALVERKVPIHQISWKGYGETRPVATNDSENGRQKNRRVECRVKE
jgi:outer membrane protein OmpA-like peptidoglycan-associated protein